MEEKYMVSVICCTYNHEKYIEKCIKGIVEQKTSFRFKLIIHDDASTDNTTFIIQKYHKMYPDIIFPIYEKENMYSKGKVILDDIILPNIDTPYVAICEGDDCWCDNNKIEMQFLYMEQHLGCGICVHDAVRVNYFSHLQDLNTKEIYEKDYSVEDVIKLKSGKFATNSIFMRTELMKKIPKEFRCSRFGDWQLIIYGAANNYLHYFPDIMSTYNQGVPGSYTEKTVENLEYNIETRYEILGLLRNLDNYYNKRFSKVIGKLRKEVRIKIIELRIRFLVKKYLPIFVIIKRKVISLKKQH